MSLDDKDVAKIAHLSRIHVTAEECTRYREELNSIFGWIEQLQEVDTEGVPPMAGVGNYTLRVREDVANDGNIQEQVLQNAPQAAYGCFVVPKVVE